MAPETPSGGDGRRGRRPASEPRSDHAGVPVPPPLLYAAGLGIGIALERRWPLPRPPVRPARRLGAALLAAGAVLPASGATLFRRQGTSVLPVRPTTALVTSGP